jgi:hypothetical protein
MFLAQAFFKNRLAEAGELGFEPRLNDPESFVLPLHYSPGWKEICELPGCSVCLAAAGRAARESLSGMTGVQVDAKQGKSDDPSLVT